MVPKSSLACNKLSTYGLDRLVSFTLAWKPEKTFDILDGLLMVESVFDLHLAYFTDFIYTIAFKYYHFRKQIKYSYDKTKTDFLEMFRTSKTITHKNSMFKKKTKKINEKLKLQF